MLVSAKHQHESVTGQRDFLCLKMAAILVKASWSLLFLLSGAVFPSRLASLLTQLVKNPPAMQETPVRFLGREDLLEKGSATHSSVLGVAWCSACKKSACDARDLGSISGLERSRGEGKGYPLQYSGLENSMECIVHALAKSQTRLSDCHFSLFMLFINGLYCIEDISIFLYFFLNHEWVVNFVKCFSCIVLLLLLT